MAIAFRAAGITPGLPAGTTAGDLLLLYVETAFEFGTVPGDWTFDTSDSLGASAGAAGVTTLQLYYKIAGSSETAPSLGDAGNHTCAVILGFTGVDGGTQLDAASGHANAPSSTSVTWTSGLVTSVTAGAMFVVAVSNATDTATAQGSDTLTNANITFTPGIGNASGTTANSTAGVGGGMSIYYGIRAAAGALGTTTGTIATASGQALIASVYRPASSDTLMGQACL